MKQEDKLEVIKYLKSIDVRTMEFFEEMYDHIVTSYEARKNTSQNINEHIRDVVQPGFGGVKGIHRVMKAQQKLRSKTIFKRAWRLFKSYLLSWPTVLITVAMTMVIYQLNIIFNPKNVFLWIMGCSVFIPVLIVLIGQGRFYLDCKRQGKGYSSSDLNLRLMTLSLIGSSFVNISLNLVGRVIFGFKENTIEILASYPLLQITLCLLFSLYGLVTVQLLKEKFILKLSTD